ncbi:hypothetical protein [Paenibacillus ginsengihumi]|uniref:hypothetical protein n=1 Tax=Paenibacillus ginsengihumi TaxID=431596 RepID=UPI0009FCCCFE|nr:hypothetical protein [Paenibacillus ginsengihumi]
MLYFVQQFEGNRLQTREHRPKCCTFCNIEPQIGLIPPFLLYKIQHLPMNEYRLIGRPGSAKKGAL